MVRRDHSDIIAFDVDCEQDVECLSRRRCEQKVAGQIFVVWICLDDRVAVHRSENLVPRDMPPGQPHVHMIGPVDLLRAEALLNEVERIVWEASVRRHHLTVLRIFEARSSRKTPGE